MPITYEDSALGTNEAVKGFDKTDDLAKAYLDLHGKVSSGSMETLPQDLRENETVKFYKTVPDALKGLIETKKLVGGIKRPPADATGYKFSNVDGLDASVKPDAGFQKVIAEEALKAGLPAEHADFAHKISMQYLNNLVLKQRQAGEERFKANDAILHQEWGADYEKNFNGVVRMLVKSGVDEKDAGSAMKNAPNFLKGLGKIMSLLSEDSIENLGGHEGGGGATDAEEKEYQEYRTALQTQDLKHAYFNEKLPGHMKAVERFTYLNKRHYEKASQK
jgi:hypothetical protein